MMAAYINKGLAFTQLDKNFEALDCLDKSLNIDSENGDAWFLKGVVLVELQRFDEALKCYDKSLILKPGFELAVNARRDILSKINP
ncbi:MAG: hypothetical protein CVV28_11600 [Methanobacteriales archaeon HGW-Methanobacteriales-1]|jgi:tetratricopeptide (TPR) repeat protein|nr:MAG: hypothetical protein CVV28_11600 [Methanobacteriales archaeon HGW-Methanobacteriales-1]